MSYEIVKNCRVEHNSNNKGYHATLTTACNNLRPLYYSEWYIGINETLSKEDIEKILLLEFFHGNLQRGTSKYVRTVQAIRNNAPHLLDKYYRIDKVMDKLSRRIWRATSEQRNTPRMQQIILLSSKLGTMRNNEAKEVLYNYMNTQSISRTVKPFTIRDKVTGEYVTKINQRTYRTGFTPKQFTSAKIYSRVTNPESWWVKHFTIEQV